MASMPLDEDPTFEPKPIPGPSKTWEWIALLAILLVATGLRVWKLDQNGTGNPYYGACVRSMLASPSNFFYASFDSLGIVTVDKPPVALWIQGASARVFGFSGLSVLLPQAVMGVISVGLIYGLVRRVFGAGAGLIAALALAVTPICVAIDRDNLPDSALVLTLLLATWLLSKASETGKLFPLLGAMALVGLAFNIKMLAAFVVLPTFALAYWLAAPVGWKTRFVRLAASGLVLAATSLSWAIAVELVPKDQRPYIGGSRNNSALELALGYNGIARIMGMGGFGPPGMRPGAPPASPGAEPKQEPAKAQEKADADAQAPPGPGPDGPGRPPFGRGGPMFGGTPGFARFANPGIIGLITWLFPLAILGSMVAATRYRLTWPIGREHLALVVWGGWFATHWVVFSFARGIFHEYYTTAIGPAVAALAGIGAMALWESSRQGGWRTLLLPGVVLLTAAWQGSIFNHYPDWRRWLLPTLIGGSGVGSLGLIASRWLAGRGAKVSATLALGVLFVGPTLWSLGCVLAPGNSMMPASDPAMFGVRRDQAASNMPFGPGGGPGGPMENNPKETEQMIAFLKANRKDETILIASQSSMPIAPIIIQSGETAISLGGFMGADPAVSKDQFIKMVEDGKLRFFLVGGPGGPPGPGGGGPGGPPGGGPPGRGAGGPPRGPMGNPEILNWVREHGKPVDPKLWKPEEPDHEDESKPDDPGQFFRRMRRSTQIFDLRPELGLKPAR
jgi:4-amino-4-deoxy-L-arabinose transferase-like glycosyltransferase